MRCPYCTHEGAPSPSGPYDLSHAVTGVVFLVCPGCQRYTGAFVLPPIPEPQSVARADLREAA